MSVRGDRPISGEQLYDRTPAQAWRSRLLAEINNPNLLAIVFFCAIGLLLTAVFIQSFPNLGEMAETFEELP
jgi:hypothetical protein